MPYAIDYDYEFRRHYYFSPDYITPHTAAITMPLRYATYVTIHILRRHILILVYIRRFHFGFLIIRHIAPLFEALRHYIRHAFHAILSHYEPPYAITLLTPKRDTLLTH